MDSNSNNPLRISNFTREIRKSLGLPEQQLPEPAPQEPTEEAKRYFAKLKEETTYPTMTASDLMKKLDSCGYEIDEHNQDIAVKLCYYFSGDTRMKSLGLDPNKGIGLIGNLGVGKTLLMKILRFNTHLPFAVINCSDIIDEVERSDDEGGTLALRKYFYSRRPTNPQLYGGKEIIGICYNELGREKIPAKYFGNPVNIMERIFFSSYENQIPFNHLHFTTNKSPQELTALYGDYIGDRMREMFNLVYFPTDAKTRRK